MIVFLCYASERRKDAERIYLALSSEGHKIFFDRERLSTGEAYHQTIRNWVKKCDLFMFLISPESVAKDSYCLTELSLARERWPVPAGRVLPVLIAETDMEVVPEYVKAVTVLIHEGDLSAKVAARVADLVSARRRRLVRMASFIGLALLLVVAGLRYASSVGDRTDGDLDIAGGIAEIEELPSALVDRVRIVDAITDEFVLALDEPPEVRYWSSAAEDSDFSTPIDGEPVSMALGSDIVAVATRIPDQVVLLSLPELDVIRTIELSNVVPSNEDPLATEPKSVAVTSAGIWFTTSGDLGSPGAFILTWDDSPALYLADLTFEADDLRLRTYGDTVWGVPTETTPTSLFRLSTEPFEMWGGHDFDAVSCASDLVPNGPDRVSLLSCDDAWIELNVAEGRPLIEQRTEGIRLSSTEALTETWDEHLHAPGEGWDLVTVSIHEIGSGSPVLSRAARFEPSGPPLILWEEEHVEVMSTAVVGDSGLLVLRDSERQYRTIFFETP